MSQPGANRGGRRDGFGAGREGHGAGRTGRTNVWQRTGRIIPDETEEGEFHASQEKGNTDSRSRDRNDGPWVAGMRKESGQ